MNIKPLLIIPLLLVPACNTSPTVVTIPTSAFSESQLGQDLTLVARGITPVVEAIKNNSDIDTATKERVSSLLTTIQTNTDLLIKANGVSLSHGTIQLILTSINGILKIASLLPVIPEPYLSIIQAIAVILPVIEREAGFTGGGISTGHITGGDKFNQLTLTQARLILQGLR